MALAITGRPTTGILVVGTVEAIDRRGRLHTAKILLTETNELVTVVSRVGLPAKRGDRLVVLGVVIQQPAEQLVGYDGDLPVVIWAGSAARLR